jgi:predicted ATPase
MITKIRIRNFKSFEDTTVNLKPFNVLIGSNDSGKSNFLSVFRVISGMMWNKLDDVFSSPLLFANTLFQGSKNEAISFDIGGSTTRKEPRTRDQQESFEFEYSVKISTDEKGVLYIAAEKLRIRTKNSDKMIQHLSRSGEITKVNEGVNNKKHNVSYHFDSDRCAISLLSDIKRHAYIRAVRYELGLSGFYNFQPSKMKLPTEKKEKGNIVVLNQNGHNLGEVLFYLQESYPDKFKNLKNSLRDAIPSVEDLQVTPIEKWIFVSIEQRYNGQLLKLNLGSISDGLLRFLGILSIVHNPFAFSSFLFEELENGIHPRRLQTVIELMRFLSLGPKPIQVFITTHSPYLVDYVKPEDVLVVDRLPSTGATIIKSIEKKKGISKLLDEFSLGEAWFSGALGGIP